MRKLTSLLVALAVTFVLIGPAVAHDDDVPAERATLIAVDALAVAAGLTVALAEPFYSADDIGRLGRGAFTTLGIGLLAGPSVHWAYEHDAKGALSVGVRALLPLLTGTFGLIGVCTFRQSETGCARDGMAYGTALGTIVAAGLDSLLITSLHQKRPPPPTKWYGWQTLAVDAAGIGVGLLLFAQASGDGVSDEGIVTFPMTQWLGVWLIGTLGAPIIHAVHAEWLSAGASLAARALGGPALSLGGMIAYCAAVAGEDGCVTTGLSWGLMGGAFFMAALDATLLAREKLEPDDPTKSVQYLGPGLVGDAPGLILSKTF